MQVELLFLIGEVQGPKKFPRNQKAVRTGTSPLKVDNKTKFLQLIYGRLSPKNWSRNDTAINDFPG